MILSSNSQSCRREGSLALQLLIGNFREQPEGNPNKVFQSHETAGVKEMLKAVTSSLPSRKDQVVRFGEYLSEASPAFTATATGLAAPTPFSAQA